MLRRCHDVVLVLLGLFILAGVDPVWAKTNDPHAKAKGLAHYIMATCYDYNGDAPLAIKEYEQSIRFNADVIAPRLRLGAYYVRLNRVDDAITQFKSAIKIAPDDASQARYLLGLIYSSQKKFDLAAQQYESILQHAVQHNPGNVEVHLYLSELYYAQGKFLKAIDQLIQVLHLKPDDAAAWHMLGSLYVETNQRPLAMDAFKRAVKLEPDHDRALNALGYMYAEEGIYLKEAITMIRHAIEIEPTNGAYYDSLGWALYKKGLNAEALMAMQKAEGYTQEPIIYDHMGDVYKALKELTMARKFWQRSLAMNPDQPALRQKIQELEKTQASNKGH